MMFRCFTKIKRYVGNIITSRNILYALIYKELVGKYKNSILGLCWNFIIPLSMLLIYYIMFTGGIRSSPIDNFLVYLSSGLFPFSFLLTNLTTGSDCITSNGAMLKKIYFPREIFVLSKTISIFIIMIVGYAISLIMIALAGYPMQLLNLLILIPAMITIFIFALGINLFFSSINVYIRDVQSILSSLTLALSFITPVYFAIDGVDGILNTLIWINPLSYFIDCLHHCIYYAGLPAMSTLAGMLVLSVFSITIGLLTFKKLEPGFAERL